MLVFIGMYMSVTVLTRVSQPQHYWHFCCRDWLVQGEMLSSISGLYLLGASETPLPQIVTTKMSLTLPNILWEYF